MKYVFNDGAEIDYYITQEGTLCFRYEGTDWQDFIPNDKRAYSTEQYQELMDILLLNN